jgi:protein gp37
MVKQLDWVVIGACTGEHPSQPEDAWVQDIADVCCRGYTTPVFVKSNLTSPRFQGYKQFWGAKKG